MTNKLAMAVLALGATTGVANAEKIKFEYWYGLTGDLGAVVAETCNRFNASQNEYEAVCVAQAGYEKALSITMAAHAGANLITQTAGMQAGLMGASMEAYVIDNDMLGAIRRSPAPVEISLDTLCATMIAKTIRSDGHFLGHPQTFDRMKSDFLYPGLADRRSIADWQASGARDIRVQAKELATEILAGHFPQTLAPAVDTTLRETFDIRLPVSRLPTP